MNGRKAFAAGSLFLIALAALAAEVPDDLAALLPKPADWPMTEEVQTYTPESLFEYIDGAAESYLVYEFRELVVGQYRLKDGPATMTVEIYDMARPRNAFGIYGSERYPESRFLAIGGQGYLEEGTLNFFAGRYYIKLLCFEAGAAAEGHLRRFAAETLKSVPDVGSVPAEFAAFPKEGRVANSEKYIRTNVLGFKFLSEGFFVSYRADGGDFEAFLIEGRTPDEAAEMLGSLAAEFAKRGTPATTSGAGVRLKDPYLGQVVLVRAGRYLCGASKLKDGVEGAGEAVVAAMAKAILEPVTPRRPDCGRLF